MSNDTFYVSVLKDRIRIGKQSRIRNRSKPLEGELLPVMPAAASQLQRFKSAVGLTLTMVKLWPLEVPAHPIIRRCKNGS
jgi:hypothetical protein